MYVSFGVRSTDYNRYDIDIPDELKDASDWEIQVYIEDHFDEANFVSFIDSSDQDLAFETLFERKE